MSFKHQRMRDPLHNLIEFRANEFENAMWETINTRPFQRLRRVKQLGFSDFVYPGATHSRLAHSVGVFHTARQLMNIVEEQQGESRFSDIAASRALAAALVHDIGHGPFSHAFENVGKRLGLEMAKHEKVSDAIIRESEVTGALNKRLGGNFANEVADLIGSKSPTNIYSAVVSSQFDADRLDYMQRDRFMSGTQGGAIDFKWLMANLRVGKVTFGVDAEAVGEVETFVLGRKAIYAAESYVLGLFQLYPTVYFHKTTRCAEKLFEELFCRAFQLINENNIAMTGLHEQHPLVKFARAPSDLSNVLSLDDTVMWGAIYQFIDASDKVISQLATRLRDRKFYKSIDIREAVTSLVGQNQPKLIDKACISIEATLTDWANKNNTVFPRILLDKAKRSPYNRLDESKGPLNQIHIHDANDRLVDLADLSDAVRAIQAFHVFRAYIVEDDKDAKIFIEDTINTEAKNVTNTK